MALLRCETLRLVACVSVCASRERLIRKWGGVAEFEAQKQRHRLKERGLEVGIKHFNLDRIASSTFLSHRLVQCEAMPVPPHAAPGRLPARQHGA